MDFLETYRTYTKHIWCIAHNFQGFDGHFIIAELFKRDSNIKPIMNGLKLLKIQYKGYIHFIDSISFIPMPLSKFPKTFGINHYEKGYYPHLFNTIENLHYVGTLPDMTFYQPNCMTTETYKKFKSWYENRKENNFIFDNYKELISYCKDDVNILREGCVRFMKNFINLTEINPLLQTITIAQAVMLAFRKKYLIPNTIGIVPRSNNYNVQYKSVSEIGMKWLCYKEEELNIKLIREYNIPNTKYYVDGFHINTNMIFEFFGCYYHGCNRCFQNRDLLVDYGQETIENRYATTVLRIEKLKQLGYSVTLQWECDFKQILSKNPTLNEYLCKEIQFALGLNPRDAVFGGRTEVFQVYANVQQNEKIRYFDFTSLYPFINKYGIYPIGHPTEIYRDPEIMKSLDILKMEGFIKCVILPPQNLLYPIIPTRINNKLIFTLCRMCAEQQCVTTRCTHEENDRCLLGTWTICEVKLGIEYGYKITQFIEIWKYDTMQYNKNDENTGLFTKFIDKFLKVKQEASGWPENCTTIDQQEKYINDYFSHEGIQLNKENIENNSSLRTCAKLCANSFWGKFIEREDRSQVEVINNVNDYFTLISSPGVEVIEISFPSEEIVWVVWKFRSDIYRYHQPPHISIPVGAYTTAQARIKLFKELILLDRNVIYCDTDSVIFKENALITLPKLGNYLGELTDELVDFGKDAYIKEFVSTGPKSYSFIIKSPTSQDVEITKSKGVIMNRSTMKVVNFDSLKRLITEDTESITVSNERTIKRKKIGCIVSTKNKKIFQFTYDKRILLEDLTTIPFGFQ